MHDYKVVSNSSPIIILYNIGRLELLHKAYGNVIIPLLHKGEIEAIVLAKEINANLVIIDDFLARKYAQYLGLTITGTLGVIVKAKQKGLIKNVKPIIDEMLESGFWIDNKVYLNILKIAGE